jgi:hypothetical protein
LIFAPFLLSAKINTTHFYVYTHTLGAGASSFEIFTDTTKNNKKPEQGDKKIKEIAKAKKQPKPEKIEPPDNSAGSKSKPKRQRRPEGLERPPEIPRRNGN